MIQNDHPTYKIAIIVCYFGNLPPWMDIHLETCKNNPTITWLLFSDAQPPQNDCGNVIFHRFSLPELNRLASRQLGLKIAKDIYTLHDLYPMYGHIFSEQLRDFDFWGHGQLDTFYGDLRKFLSTEVLENHDIFSGRKDTLSGHLTLYRNDPEINSLLLLYPAYKSVMENQSYFFGAVEILLNGVLRTCWSDFCRTGKMKKIWWNEEVMADHPMLEACKDGWYWEDGKIRNQQEKDKEYLYLHFMKWKESMQDIKLDWKTKPRQFSITETGVYPMQDRY